MSLLGVNWRIDYQDPDRHGPDEWHMASMDIPEKEARVRFGHLTTVHEYFRFRLVRITEYVVDQED